MEHKYIFLCDFFFFTKRQCHILIMTERIESTQLYAVHTCQQVLPHITWIIYIYARV